MAEESIVDRVELLKKVGKLKFYFKRCKPSTLKKPDVLAPLKVYSTGKTVLLVKEISKPIEETDLSKDTLLVEEAFSIMLPFEINITTLDDNLKKAQLDINHQRIIVLGFKINFKDDSNFSMIQSDIDELDEDLGRIWDAKYFSSVENIVCSNCHFSILQLNDSEPIQESTRLTNFAEDNQLGRNKEARKSVSLRNSSIHSNFNITEEPGIHSEENSLISDLSNLSLAKDCKNDIGTDKVPIHSSKKGNSIQDENKVISQSLFTRFRNLPNEGWEELVDCWVCHNEDYTPQFSKLFCPNPSTLLVGSNYLLINISRIKLISLTDDNKISCPSCQASLGEVLTDSQMDSSVNIASPQKVAKIYKFSIGASLKNNLELFPWSSTLISDLVGKHRYQSVSRFVLYDWESYRPKILIFVVNWNIYSWKHQPSESESLHQLSQSVYVKFLEISKSTDKTLVDSWILDESVIPLSYPRAYIEEFLNNVLAFENSLSAPFKSSSFLDGYLFVPKIQV